MGIGRYRVTYTNRDSSGKVISYTLVDLENNFKKIRVTPDEVRAKIMSGNVYLTNLELAADGKTLVRRKDTSCSSFKLSKAFLSRLVKKCEIENDKIIDSRIKTIPNIPGEDYVYASLYMSEAEVYCDEDGNKHPMLIGVGIYADKESIDWDISKYNRIMRGEKARDIGDYKIISNTEYYNYCTNIIIPGNYNIELSISVIPDKYDEGYEADYCNGGFYSINIICDINNLGKALDIAVNKVKTKLKEYEKESEYNEEEYEKQNYIPDDYEPDCEPEDYNP